MNTNEYPPEGAVGIGRLMHILRLRSRWIVLGIVIGFVVAIGYAFLVPRTYTSTAVVNISVVSSDPTSDTKSAASLIDLPTERQIATSSRTASGAADDLGEGWTEHELKENVKATAETGSTVIRISYTDRDMQRSVDAANALATSYLDVRTALVRERSERTIDAIDQEIKQAEQEIADMQDINSDVEYDPERIAILRDSINSQEQRKATFTKVSADGGEVITSANAASSYAQPARTRLMLLGLLAGVFLGVVLALIRHGLSRTPLEASDVAAIFAAPVWRPSGRTDDPQRWSLAAELARHHAGGETSPALLVDKANKDARLAGEELSGVLGTPIIDLSGHRSEAVAALDPDVPVILVVPLGWAIADLKQLASDIAAIPAQALGVVVADVDEKGVTAHA